MLSEFVKALGADKVKEISDGVCKPAKPVKEEKPAKTEVKAETKKTVKKEQADGGAAAAGEKTKRIARMSPTLTNQLKAELIKIGIVFIDDDKKQVELLKKEFTRYIDNLSEGDFTAKDLANHMRDFANTKKPAPEKEEPVVKKAPSVMPTFSNAAAITDVDIDELRAIKMIAKPGSFPDGRKWNGEFWDGDEGRFVRGPAREDGDGNHVKFNGKDYYYEAGSFRVYEEIDDKDVFVGYVGVGQFRDMKV